MDRLSAALSDRYAVEREVGAGGMATVYLAVDLKHHRKVAVKVLRPELAAAIGSERFLKEIEIAAQLQHPHILPLYDSGEADSFLYYVMPYVEGESLRDRLHRETQLPVDEAVRLAREVATALNFAHGHGVVHRDIKPENILLTAGTVVVADFGIALAVAAAGGERLTQTGVAVGTPTYMSPEQAAGDRQLDQRSDIYALGCVLYEMLAGQAPFTGATIESLIHQHIAVEARPIIDHRPAVPAGISEALAKALAKTPADRFGSASQFAEALKVSTPSAGVTPVGTEPVSAADSYAGARHPNPARVAGLFGLASVAILGVVYLFVILLGLPDWVMWGAVILQAIGLPIMLVTGQAERRRVVEGKTGGEPSSIVEHLRERLTWRNAVLGGVAAFAVLGVVTAAYMSMRVLGVGPVGTLYAAGVLDEQDRIILADLENHSGDSTLSHSVTEALRIDLSTSPVVKVMEATAMSDVLRSMNSDANTPIDARLAREIAERAGVKAVVTGEIARLGSGYVLSVRLESTADGTEHIALRETADDDTEVIRAVDRLSTRLREKIGESLKTIRGKPPLQHVTTGSLEALRAYTRALQVAKEGDLARERSLLEEAVALDTAFAMAWRRLAVVLNNSGAGLSRVMAASTKAYEHRDRLPAVERYLAIASYYWNVQPDRDEIINAYRSALEVDPDNHHALNNLASTLSGMRQYAEAEELARRSVEVDDEWQHYGNLMGAQVGQGKFDEGEATLDMFEEKWSADHPLAVVWRAELASARREFDTAETYAQALLEYSAPIWQGRASFVLFALDQVRGRLAGAERHLRESMAVSERRGLPAQYLRGAVELGLLDVRYREDPSGGRRKVAEALARYPLDSLAPPDRPYLSLAMFYAHADGAAEAKQLLAEYELEVDEALRRRSSFRHGVVATVALAEGRLDEAIKEFREWFDNSSCSSCGLFELAHSYELAGQPDSALAVYERAVSTPDIDRVYDDYDTLAQTYKRLAELYEERGESDKAVEFYDHFIALWNDADPELQPMVRDARTRLARLVGEPGGM